MRKTLILVLTLSLLLVSVGLAVAAAPPTIYINGTDLASEDPAVLENDRTLLPLRAIFEALDQQVEWKGEDQSITSGNIWLQIDNPVAIVDGENVDLDVPAKLINDVTYVPLRFIAESLGKDVAWDGSQNRVDITDKPAVDEEIDEEATDEEDATTGEATDEENATTDEEATDEENATTDEDVTTEEDATADEDATVDEDTENEVED